MSEEGRALQVVNGAALNGTGLARLIEQMVTALNARDIPTAGSILEHFNKELMYKVCHATLSVLLLMLDQVAPSQSGPAVRPLPKRLGIWNCFVSMKSHVMMARPA